MQGIIKFAYVLLVIACVAAVGGSYPFGAYLASEIGAASTIFCAVLAAGGINFGYYLHRQKLLRQQRLQGGWNWHVILGAIVICGAFGVCLGALFS